MRQNLLLCLLFLSLPALLPAQVLFETGIRFDASLECVGRNCQVVLEVHPGSAGKLLHRSKDNTGEYTFTSFEMDSSLNLVSEELEIKFEGELLESAWSDQRGVQYESKGDFSVRLPFTIDRRSKFTILMGYLKLAIIRPGTAVFEEVPIHVHIPGASAGRFVICNHDKYEEADEWFWLHERHFPDSTNTPNR